MVAKLDSDAHRDVASRFGVTGYPTLKVRRGWHCASSLLLALTPRAWLFLLQFFPRGTTDKTAEDYNGGREADDFITFLNEKSGSKRLLGGRLATDAGLLADFDDYAKKFMASCVHSPCAAAARSVCNSLALPRTRFAASGAPRCSGADKKAVLAEAKSSLDILTKDELVFANNYIKVRLHTTNLFPRPWLVAAQFCRGAAAFWLLFVRRGGKVSFAPYRCY